MRQKDYTAMARSVEALRSVHDEIQKLLEDLDEARGRRDNHVKEAIGAGVTWRAAADAGGISTVQVGKIMKRPDPPSAPVEDPADSAAERPVGARRAAG